MPVDLSRLPPELQEYAALAGGVGRGDIEPFIRRYFKVKNLYGQTVPAEFTPNQRMFYDRLIAPLATINESIDAICVKDRKATWSTWTQLVTCATFFTVPGVDVVTIANNDKNLTPIVTMVDTIYQNMPEYAKPKIYNDHWGSQMKQLVFSLDGETVINTMMFSSSRSPNFGRGFTIKIVNMDEMAYYDPSFDSEGLMDSIPPGAWIFRGSTPNGPDGLFYDIAMQTKNVERRGVYIFCNWMMNPENRLPAGSSLRRPVDRGGCGVGMDEGQISWDTEQYIANHLKDRNEDPEAGVAWRRYKLADALVANQGDPRLAKAKFLQEHAEDDKSCWVNLVNPQFDINILESQLGRAGSHIVAEDRLLNGVRYRKWLKPIPGHIYVIGVDYSSDHGKDFSAVQVIDTTDRILVAELHGKCDPHILTQLAVHAGTEYNNALLVQEVNGLGEGEPNFARHDLGYQNVYRRRMRDSETMESSSYRKREWGWRTTGSSKTLALNSFIGDFNLNRFMILNPDLLDEMGRYDPDAPKKNKAHHLPDRVAAACFAYRVASERNMFGTGSGTIAKKEAVQQKRQGWGRRSPRPFALVR